MNTERLRELRRRLHALRPVVILGQQGLSDGVLAEIDRALHDHELIKVRLNGAERDDRRPLAEDMAQKTSAEIVMTIGKMVALYRARPEQPPKAAPIKRNAPRGSRAPAPRRGPRS